MSAHLQQDVPCRHADGHGAVTKQDGHGVKEEDEADAVEEGWMREVAEARRGAEQPGMGNGPEIGFLGGRVGDQLAEALQHNKAVEPRLDQNDADDEEEEPDAKEAADDADANELGARKAVAGALVPEARRVDDGRAAHGAAPERVVVEGRALGVAAPVVENDKEHCEEEVDACGCQRGDNPDGGQHKHGHAGDQAVGGKHDDRERKHHERERLQRHRVLR